MPYPEHLLPKANYRKIDWRPELCSYFLLRNAQEADLIDPETGLVRDKFITSGSREQLLDFSTNLYGIFKTHDAAFEWDKDGRKAYFTTDWEVGTEVDTPVEEDYAQRELFGYFFYNVGVLHQYPQPIAIPRVLPHTQARCYVCHTPVNGNFWHFSVRWKIGSEDIETALTKNERRDLLSLVKTFLKTHAVLHTKNANAEPIPEAWYIS